MQQAPLSKDYFLSSLKLIPEGTGRFFIAYSGGMDSSVLLHLINSVRSEIPQSITVVHVNHGLNKISNRWAHFCQEQSESYGLDFIQLNIEESCPKDESIEAWARDRRYKLIAEKMKAGDILFTAHHKNDQVETFFLQALRGSGPRGLVSMPFIKPFANGFHLRPLLTLSCKALALYAKKNQLVWYDDESNFDECHDRNFLRHTILPRIEARWPAYQKTITRLISHQKEYKQLLDEIAEQDLLQMLQKNTLNLMQDKIRQLSIERQKNLIFVWLAKSGLAPPGSRHIHNILTDLINRDTEKSPCINWKNVEVRRYKNVLFAGKPLEKHDNRKKYSWDLKKPISLGHETVEALSAKGTGISKKNTKQSMFEIRYRQGGEKINPDKSNYSRTVKQLFQESGVLPWYRDRVPLVYIDNKLALIPGLCIDKEYCADRDEPSWDIKWSGYEKAIIHE